MVCIFTFTSLFFAALSAAYVKYAGFIVGIKKLSPTSMAG
jgi:hypothetical protein